MASYRTEADEATQTNEAGLSRVTYLGGLLLPFSVVAAILSMDGIYGPGGEQFWLFWAISIPLTAATLFIIYADDIRRWEVWVEVAAGNLEETVDVDDAMLSVDEVSFRRSSVGRSSRGKGRGSQSRSRSRSRSRRPGRYARVRVATGLAGMGDALSYQALEEVAAPGTTAPGTTVPETGGAAGDEAEGHQEQGDNEKEPRSTAVLVDDDIQEIVIEVVSAQRRRRFRIVQPLAGSAPGAPHEPGSADDTIVVDLRPLPIPERPSRYTMRPASVGTEESDRVRVRVRRSRSRSRTPVIVAPRERIRRYSLAATRPTYVLQQAAEGAQPRAWRRQQLGWLGAAGAIVGVRRPQRAEEMPDGTATVQRPRVGGRRTWTRPA